VKRWVLVGLLGCVALAFAYLPPRGAKSSGRNSFFIAQPPQGTPARRRAQALAEQWRAAEGALHLLRTRRQLQERVQQAAGSGWASSLVVMSESDGVSGSAPKLVDSAMHAAWSQLGLGETKVKVAVVIELVPSSAVRDRPLPEAGVGTYLAPDSTDRTTCVAVVPAGPYWSRVFSGDLRRSVPFDALVQSLKAGLGPCAFYAVYGTPGKPVRRWLVTRGWDLALILDPGAPGRQQGSLIEMADPRYPWYWDAIYSLPPPAVACLASRPEGCRAAVLAGANEDLPIPVPDIMRIDRRWGRTQRLVEAQRFLADVAHEVGRERFLTFWTSGLPVDTALAAALKRPVGEWTAEWQRGFVSPIRLGPAPPLGAVAMALTLAALALSLVVLTASRRQVR
jgi:AcrR family transcriptional regulator